MYYVPELTPGCIQDPARSVNTPHREADTPVVLRDRRLICSNEVFSVYFDRLEQPDGRQVVDYLSVIPKTPCKDGISGVAVLPEFDGKLGLVHVYRHPLGAAAWEIPRGFVDPEESVSTAALRELREETGMETAVSNLVDLGRLAPEPGVIAARIQMYWARQCVPASSDGAKELGHGALRFFSPDEVANLIAGNEIQDPCTLVACFRHGQVTAGMASRK
jgi:8-oxo-dGTP pyrophosphatase MutT (NUDIX family)